MNIVAYTAITRLRNSSGTRFCTVVFVAAIMRSSREPNHQQHQNRNPKDRRIPKTQSDTPTKSAPSPQSTSPIPCNVSAPQNAAPPAPRQPPPHSSKSKTRAPRDATHARANTGKNTEYCNPNKLSTLNSSNTDRIGQSSSRTEIRGETIRSGEPELAFLLRISESASPAAPESPPKNSRH